MNFFKRIFGKPDQKEELVMNLEDCRKFLIENSAIIKKLKDFNPEFKKLTREIESDFELLNKAQFEKDADKMIISRASSNRDAYINQVRIFLKRVGSDELSFENVTSYITNFDSELHKFGKHSFRSYFIVESIFKREARSVAEDLKKIDGLVSDLKKLIASKDFNVIKDSLETIQKINDDKILAGKIKIDFSDKEAAIKELEKNINETKKQINKIKNGNEYKDVIKSKENKLLIEEQIKANRAEVIRLLSPVQRIMRKFQKIEDSSLIISYLNDPLTLFVDPDLKIIGLLKKVESAIISDKLDLKNEKKSKSLSALKEIKRELLIEFLSKDQQLEADLAKIKSMLETTSVLRDLAELDIRLSNYFDRLSTLNVELENLKSWGKNFDSENLKGKLENNLSELFSKEIKIEL